MATDVEIDDSLYSRQRYVLGDSAMKRMAQSSILLYGVGGLGAEIAKNIVLAGIKTLTIQDPAIVTRHDLGTQFFLREEDVQVGRNRAEATVGRLAELNPYVNIHMVTSAIDLSSDLSYLKNFQCVILTDLPLQVRVRINQFCRSQSPQIKFLSADVFGLFSGTFCDVGDKFEVMDPNGEEPKETFIASITKDNPGVVTSLDNKMHGFESQDTIIFKEVNGMTILNGKQVKIDVISPYAFTIGDTTREEFGDYESGGIATQVKVPKTFQFNSMEVELKRPNIMLLDFRKWEMPIHVHVGFIALDRFREQNQRFPNLSSINTDVIEAISFTCKGCFAPLCAAQGGIIAQEAIKALTGKFTPLKQWLYLDALDLLNEADRQQPELFKARGDRYDQLRICIGENCMRKLTAVKLFMVGCGAIGCEMLKNYALMGIGTDNSGQIIITDNDLIEKSNLNRQFLFRPHHIRKPKSVTAAESVLQINPDLHIVPQQNKVCPQTEDSIYPDRFYENLDLVVNALDNVEARRYVDSRCVTSQRPLLESGTMGTKGHTQVIVPHLTESYVSQRDPPDEEVPYCTLKSFPANIEHCIQWARDKFESSFVHKPSNFNKFWSNAGNIKEIIEKLKTGQSVDGAVITSKLLSLHLNTWPDCVRIGRHKFEKLFNHKARHLIDAFPLETRLADGSLFWQSPKRPPVPLQFDLNDPQHLSFVISCARLYADIFGVQWTQKDLEPVTVKSMLSKVDIPPYVPTDKKVETVESKVSKEVEISGDELVEAAIRIQETLQHVNNKKGSGDYYNLRASMYHIESSDRLQVKRIAGRIVPAIATTTAAVAGMISIELVKVVEKFPREKYTNCFLNLALPIMLLSEPGPAERTVIREGLSFTTWDRWEVKGHKDLTLKEFLHYFKVTYGFEASMVGQGVKLVYVPFMPQHQKRLTQPMLKLLKATNNQKYVDLVVSFASADEDIPGPPVRYFFGL
ncbi:hypothetical protein ACJMK2_043889 [Sinanodonta woodiana]|uniref:E1 ubiquitin-activating enzyme n=1 Tax=Sinanodonta woodiana TaxID=1069815 RepID=A0ABD3W137_SINWO